MSGVMDPTRHSTHELSPADILRRVKDICKTMQTVFAWGLEPYYRDHPAPMVSRSAFADIPLPNPIYFLSRHIHALSDISFTLAFLLLLLWFLTNCLSSLQKFSFQDLENSRITIIPDRTVPDPEDPDHEDNMPKNTRAASAAGKASSSRHSIQDWSDDNSDGECLMFFDPMPLAYAFPTMPLPAIPDDEVIYVAPLNQVPPPGARAGKKHSVRPQPEPVAKMKRQKIGVPLPKKQRHVASG
jgi:hypothetical protein